ncbi:uncharacterized protein [Spinacia oleracea]|uniref:Retrotransposon gag domain-containing protein n=1 Tax=Spinacia oleracea TaxID=3562 RepID=A0A9R0I6I9_SPIOL|nr:uncharacterized protein LOC110782545 [Spinacia oleracea]
MIERHQFGGEAGEDPNLYIQSFIQYCSTIKQMGLTPEQTMEILFPFSLSGKESLALAFYVKYFPPEKTARLRSQIISITQQADESLFEVWERFKDLHREFPHHGLSDWFLIQQFYNGLGNDSRLILDSAASGRFIQLAVTRALEMQKSLSEKDAKIDALTAHNKIIDTQLAQMATTLAGRPPGQLPSQPENRETANAITLRSG